jgi:hypothetical protein
MYLFCLVEIQAIVVILVNILCFRFFNAIMEN